MQEIPNESIPDRLERLFAKPRATSKDQAKEMILDNYYYNSDKNKGKIFLLKQNKFIPLESLDEKLAECKEKKNSPEFKDSFAFQYDFRIMTLIKEHRQTAENLERDYADTYNRIMNRLGEASLKLILSNPKEAWKPGSEKILEEYAIELGSYKGLPNTTMLEKPPFFIYARSLLSEPIPAEEPTTMPEQDYLDKLMLESEFKSTISDATKTLRGLWRGIIPVDDTRKTPIPYQSPKPIAYLSDINIDSVISKLADADEKRKAYAMPSQPDYDKKPAPMTNIFQLKKALGLDDSAPENLGSEDLDPDDLESAVFKALPKNPGEIKESVPTQGVESLINYDKTKCRRDPINETLIRCLESPNKYNTCAYQHKRFKNERWQCCTPDA